MKKFLSSLKEDLESPADLVKSKSQRLNLPSPAKNPDNDFHSSVFPESIKENADSKDDNMLANSDSAELDLLVPAHHRNSELINQG